MNEKKLEPYTIVAQSTMRATLESLEWIRGSVNLPNPSGGDDVIDLRNDALGCRWVCVRIPIKEENA